MPSSPPAVPGPLRNVPLDGERPPVAPARPGADPYAWMRDHTLPEMLSYLAAERAYYDRQTAPSAALREELAAGLAARVAPAEESVSWRQGGFDYFTRNLPGQEYQQFCRREQPGSQAQVLLDENELLADPACGGGYVCLGVREVSPDGRLLAYSVDFDGDEVYQLRFRDLTSGEDVPAAGGEPDRVERTYYGLAWSADSRAVYYTVTDAKYRPFQVWRREVGGGPGPGTLIYTEADERFDLTVRPARSGAFIFIETASRDTTETIVIPASGDGAGMFVLQPRRKGIEYRADHAAGPDGGDFYLVTNDEAVEFRLLRRPAGGGPSREVIGAGEGTRLVSCDVFGGYLVLTQRSGGATQLRVVDAGTGEERLIESAGPEITLELAENREHGATAVTVRTESLIDPPSWHDVDLASGRWQLRKRQQVPGYDAAGYRTERIYATAPDGTAIPVTLACRRDVRPDATAPCLLYGYGAYESCSWPEFSLPALSLIDRGYVYAVAHVRGGGEGGRRWWLEGRLDRKRNTFTDFIAAADALASSGWVAPDRIVSRGLSAGGLLQGAVFSMAPRRWRAVVAEVPFVDCVTSMSDPDIPLTVNEWDEWGDPRDPAARAYMLSYTPYENVPPDPRPTLLVTGSLHDPRVLVHEPAKWVARLRATGQSRLLFRAELGAGAHTGPAGRYAALAYEAEVLAFVITQAGEGPGRS